MRAVLIDYGAGNQVSVHRALEHAGVPTERCADPAAAAGADALVLPGQGHFGQVMRSFLASGFEPLVREHLQAGKPFLGICVGLQILMEGSEEAPEQPGLGLLPGMVRRFRDPSVSVPQMGWNTITKRGDPPLLRGLDDGTFVYFAHAYYVAFGASFDASYERELTGATTRYGDTEYPSALSYGNLHATQFHPEKSQRAGLRVLQNFGELVRGAVATDR